MRWVSQLKDGYMLKETSNKKYVKVYTGYPYPDTDAPQKELLRELFSDLFTIDCASDTFDYKSTVDFLMNKMVVDKSYSYKDLVGLLNYIGEGVLDKIANNDIYFLGSNKYYSFYAIRNKEGIFDDVSNDLNWNQLSLVLRKNRNVEFIYVIRSKFYNDRNNKWLDILKDKYGVTKSKSVTSEFLITLKEVAGVLDLNKIVYIKDTEQLSTSLHDFVSNIVLDSVKGLKDCVKGYYESVIKAGYEEELVLVREMEKFLLEYVGFSDFITYNYDSVWNKECKAGIVKFVYQYYIGMGSCKDAKDLVNSLVNYISTNSRDYFKILVKNNLRYEEGFASKFEIRLKGLGVVWSLSDVFKDELHKRCCFIKPYKVDADVLYFDTSCVCEDNNNISFIVRDLILDKVLGYSRTSYTETFYTEILDFHTFLKTVYGSDDLTLGAFKLMVKGTNLIEKSCKSLLFIGEREKNLDFNYVCLKKLYLMMFANKNKTISIMELKSGFDGFHKVIPNLEDIIFSHYILDVLESFNSNDEMFFDKSDYSFDFNKSALTYSITKVR